MLGSKEHYELMTMFEKEFSHRRLERENKELWKIGVVYQDGQMVERMAA